MARRRDINDIDEDEEGQIVDYSGDSDDDNKSKRFHWSLLSRFLVPLACSSRSALHPSLVKVLMRLEKHASRRCPDPLHPMQ